MTVYIGADEPDALTEAAAAAVERWNGRLGVDVLELRARPRATAPHEALFSITIASLDWPAPPEGEMSPVNARSLPYGVLNGIIVRRSAIDTLPPRSLEWLIDHEIGHCFGLAHDDKSPNLMNSAPRIGRESQAISKAQGRRARSIAGIESAL